jgi:anti-sigma regulatory factor (Ser/Thr protein kinase)
VVLSSDPSSVREARHFVVQNLEAWGYDEASWAAAQIVSELASNCALHARTEFEVRLVQQDSALRLEVRDSSPARVQQRRYSAQSTTGRGLRLVDTLSRSWGVDVDDRGKTVWVALQTAADVSETGDLDEAVDLASLIAAFGDDDAGQRPTRAAALAWRVAA